MEWWMCFPVGWSQALEFYTGLACGLDLAHPKLLDLRFSDPLVLLQNRVMYTIHFSSIVTGAGWLALLVAVPHYRDWLHRNKQGLSALGSEHSHKVPAVQKGHGRPSVSSLPVSCQPHSVWAALPYACPCGCRKDGSWPPPGVYCAAGGPPPAAAAALGWERTRSPPQDPARIPVNCAANWAVLWLKTNESASERVSRNVKSKNLSTVMNLYLGVTH